MATVIPGFPKNAPAWLKPYFQSNQDLTNQAKTIAAGIIDPQVAATNRAIEAKQHEITGQQMAATGVANALSQLYAPIPGAIQQAYSKAAGDISGFASGLTGAIGTAAQQQAAQAASDLARLGPAGQQMAPSQTPAAMDVANYVGGYLPAANLATEAASRMAEAEGFGAANIAALNQQALAQEGATRQEVADLQAKGLDIENTRPAETLKALNDLRTQRNQDITLGMNVWGQQWSQARQTQQDKAAAAAAKLNAKYAAQKAAREQAAFDLQVKDYMRKTGQDAWSTAKQLSDATGWVYKVVNGQPVQTNQHTVTWQRNQDLAASARTANRIRQQNANTAQRKAAAAADKTKGTGGMTKSQMITRENTWINGMARAVDKRLNAQPVLNQLGVKTGKTRPATMPPPKAVLVRKMYNALGPNLVGKAPRWTQGYLKSLIYSYISSLPNAWWDPKSYAKPKPTTPNP